MSADGDPVRPLGPDSPGLSADRPLENPADDRLGYAPFARALATAVREMVTPEGIVVGLYGAWGLGKTTALNFVEHYVLEPYSERTEDAETLVLRFNPWLFTGRIDLAVIYLAELQKAFQRRKILSRRAQKSLATLARIAGGVPVPGAGIAKELGTVLEPTAPPVRELKADVEAALAGQSKRLVVIVDDIDRLVPSEVRELFSVIKAVADFPNTVYLLAFEQNAVAAALGETGVSDGIAYLEKIVQVPFELPVPERSAIQALLIEQLNAIIGEVDEDLLNNEDLATLLRFAILPFVVTPRDVVRLTNSVRVTYAAVRGEVNVVDFLGLETARIFLPPVYDLIRMHPAMFGVSRGLDAVFIDMQEDVVRPFHERWVEEVAEPRREAAKELMGWLFPSTARWLGVQVRRYRNELQIRRGRHVTSGDFFELYLRLTLGAAVVSREMVASMIAIADDSDAFGRRLVDLTREVLPTGQTRASVMLDELVGQAQKFDAAAIPDVIGVLLDVGDELWIDDDETFLLAGNEARIRFVVEELLQRIPRSERHAVLQSRIRDARSVSTPVYIVEALGDALGAVEGSVRNAEVDPRLEERVIIGRAEVLDLEDVAAQRIARSAEADELLDVPGIGSVLFAWTAWAIPADVAAWLDEVRADNERLGRLLVASLQTGVMAGGESRHRLNPQWFARWVDQEALAADVERLRPVASEQVKIAVDQFLAEHALLQAGENPDHPHRG